MIKDLTKQLLEKFTNELKQPYNFEKLRKNIIEPIVVYISVKLYPYFLVIVLLFTSLLLLSVVNLVLVIKLLLRKI
jgi:hypothetical protein